MRVLLTGGGTAGHINPALAIAEIIRQNAPGSEIEFVGIKGGKEEDLVPREGYDLLYVDSIGMKRPLASPSNLKAFWVALTSPYSHKTNRILDEFRPDLVIGTGGFACWPIMAAAARRGIPTALHESNAKPGLAVRKLQGRVDRIWVNFEKTAEQLDVPEKILRVGNPLRKEFGVISKEEARRRLGIPENTFLILSFGGSGGAEEVNRAAVEMMKDFTSCHADCIQYHAAGKRDYEATLGAFRAAGLEGNRSCVLKDYIYDMPLRMAAADLVISRAGAMTLSELSRMKKAAILIPSPYVADNHQFLNAKTLADAGGAVLVEERTLAKGSLTQAAESLLRDRSRMHRMEEAIAPFADRDANRLIWNEISGMAGKSKKKETERTLQTR